MQELPGLNRLLIADPPRNFMQEPDSPFARLIGRGTVGPLCVQDREIVQRIFVTVRDRAWREIVPTEWDVSVDATHRRAHLKARHLSDGIDFEWQGMFEASGDLSTFSFSFEGQAHCEMEICRVGLVILHPVDFMVGAQLTAITPNGEKTLRVAAEIYPQVVVKGLPAGLTDPFSGFTIDCADGRCLQLSFEGDLFEIEDQRNWADTSFKTYCTPLRLGFPRRLPARTRIQQRLEGRLTLPQRSSGQRPRGKGAQGPPVVEGRFPAIGRTENLTGLLSASDLALRWNHVHVTANGSDFLDRLAAALNTSGSAAVELSVDVDEPVPWAACQGALEESGGRILHLIAYGTGVSPPLPSAVAALKQEAWHAGLQVPVLTGTRGYFADLNRQSRQSTSANGLAFPLSHTVHGFDERTITENVPSIGDMVNTARERWHTPNVAVAPLALFHPLGETDRFPAQLLAPWLTATLIHAALARVGTVTLSDDVLSVLCSSGSGTAAEVLSPLLELRGWVVPRMGHKLSRDLHGITLENPSQRSRYLLAANLSRNTQTFTLDGHSAGLESPEGRLSLEVCGYGVKLAKLA